MLCERERHIAQSSTAHPTYLPGMLGSGCTRVDQALGRDRVLGVAADHIATVAKGVRALPPRQLDACRRCGSSTPAKAGDRCRGGQASNTRADSASANTSEESAMGTHRE